MSRITRSSKFYLELEHRVEENRKLYRESGLPLMNTSTMKFINSYLGVNPWKVLVPISIFISAMMWLVLGSDYTEAVLRLLGGG